MCHMCQVIMLLFLPVLVYVSFLASVWAIKYFERHHSSVLKEDEAAREREARR